MPTTIRNLDRLKAKLARLNGDGERAVGFAIKASALAIQEGARRRVLVDRGTLRNKIIHVMGPRDQSAIIGVAGANSESRITKQALTIEFGRSPGKTPPPVMEIMDWVKRKKISGTYSIKTHKRTGSMASRVHEDYFIALMISRKIGKRGTPAHPFLFPAFEEEAPKIKGRIAAEINKALKALATNAAKALLDPTKAAP
jgi:hypothetical protein